MNTMLELSSDPFEEIFLESLPPKSMSARRVVWLKREQTIDMANSM